MCKLTNCVLSKYQNEVEPKTRKSQFAVPVEVNVTDHLLLKILIFWPSRVLRMQMKWMSNAFQTPSSNPCRISITRIVNTEKSLLSPQKHSICNLISLTQFEWWMANILTSIETQESSKDFPLFHYSQHIHHYRSICVLQTPFPSTLHYSLV